MKSTKDQYGSIAVSLHWLSALLIVVLLASGIVAESSIDSLTKIDILRVHIPIGITVLVLTLIRIAWWILADKKPESPPMPSWQGHASRTIHTLFYVVIIGMAASGIGMMVLSGAIPIIFGEVAEPLPNFWEYRPRVPHGLGAKIMVALLCFHAGAALYHHFWIKDGLLKRMWY